MDKNSLIILLVIVVLINSIALIYLAKTNKKTPKAVKRKVDSERNEYDSDEPDDSEGKTEIVGRAKDKVVTDSGYNKKITFSKIPELSLGERKEIIDETIIESIGIKEPGETEIIDFRATDKRLKALSYLENEIKKKYEMMKKEVFIGRDPSQCDLVITTDKYLGKKHVRFFIEGGKLYVEDLQSKNGTYVDDEKVQGICEVVSGKFKIANTEITIE
ncbi:MAG: FHA domain-containing protein [Clostridium sp.]|uniref:FHA domain-containing protein n=1 Tax=Clostridium sp. TaxID=1506 RepID=UPI003D6D566D